MLPEQGLQLFRKVLIDRIGVYTINQEINRKREGLWKGWFENSQLWYECNYKEGELVA
jgi:antitoxin component YwqK of YwqJK toxin-antitoxin module